MLVDQSLVQLHPVVDGNKFRIQQPDIMQRMRELEILSPQDVLIKSLPFGLREP